MRQNLFYVLTLILLLASCEKNKNAEAPYISGIEIVKYTIDIGDKIVLAPNIKNLKNNIYKWMLDGKEVGTGTSYIFTATKPGEFTIIFQVTNKGGVDKEVFKVKVEKHITLSLDKEIFSISKCKVLKIVPKISGPDRDDYQYEWTMDNVVVGKKKEFDFISTVADATFTLKFTASAGKQKESIICNVKVEDAEYSKYATVLIDFMYAPGGNLWSSPFGSKNTEKLIYPIEEYKQKVSEYLATNPFKYFQIGTWGSYAVFGFDHTIKNQLGKSDIHVSITDFPGTEAAFFVAYDENKNGEPDEDEWHEIKRPYFNVEHTKNYEKTFTYKGVEGVIEEDKIKYVWTDSNNDNGEQKIACSGFPGAYKNKEGVRQFFTEGGWQKNFSLKGRQIKVRISRMGKTKESFNLNIGDAIGENGERVYLPGVDFLKIQNISIMHWQDESQPMDSYIGQKLSKIQDKHIE